MITRGITRSITRPITRKITDLGYGVGVSYPLDGMSTIEAAYSLRRLLQSYNGPVIEVRRSSDSVEQDFTADEISDGTLATFIGANSGLIATWYDQSGNARHRTQTTADNQPAITISGSLQSLGSLPAIKFDGTNDLLAGTGYSISGQCIVFFVGQSPTANDDYLFDGVSANNRAALVSTSANSVYICVGSSSAGGVSTILSSAKSAAGNHVLVELNKNGVSSDIFENGTSKATGTLSTDPFVGLTIGARRDGAQTYADKIQELVIISGSALSDRAAIRSGINEYYGIY